MATSGQEYAKIALNQKSDASLSGGAIRVLSDTITFGAEVSGSTYTLGGITLPVGAVVHGLLFNTDTSTGSTTFSVGITGTTAKYTALAALTSTDTPTWRGKKSAIGVALTAAEQLIVTTAAATAPASGTMQVTVLYSVA
jgi:hypothetical protein